MNDEFAYLLNLLEVIRIFKDQKRYRPSKYSRVEVMLPLELYFLWGSDEVICFFPPLNSNIAQPGLRVSPGTCNAVTAACDLLFSPMAQKHSKVIKLCFQIWPKYFRLYIFTPFRSKCTLMDKWIHLYEHFISLLCAKHSTRGTLTQTLMCSQEHILDELWMSSDVQCCLLCT